MSKHTSYNEPKTLFWSPAYFSSYLRRFIEEEGLNPKLFREI